MVGLELTSCGVVWYLVGGLDGMRCFETRAYTSGVGAVRYEVVAPENFQRCLPGIRDIACLESAGISVMRGPTWWDEILWEES